MTTGSCVDPARRNARRERRNGDVGDAALEPSASQVAPSGTEGAEAELHHRLEGEQNRLLPDEVAVGVCEGVGSFVEQLADDHGVHDDALAAGGGHVQPGPLGMPSTRRR